MGRRSLAATELFHGLWRRWGSTPFYPLALALYPVITLASVNDELIQPQVLLPALLASALLVTGLQRLIGRRMQSAAQAAAVLTVGLLLFYSYGHVAMLVGAYIEPVPMVPLVWAILFVLGVRMVRRVGSGLQGWTPGLNAIGGLLLLLPLIGLVWGEASQQTSTPQLEPPDIQIEAAAWDEGAPPDVYYILLDGYGRTDTLQRLYGYDNRDFLNQLGALGFYVATASYANYNQTVLSLPSALNLSYLQDMDGPNEPGGFDFWMMVDLAHGNQLFEVAERAGYETVAFKGEHALTEIRDVDVFLEPSFSGQENSESDARLLRLSETNRIFLETTALRPLLRLADRMRPEDPELARHRELIRFVLDQLPARAADPDPQFVFAHILAPHPPFVFEPDGEPRRSYSPYTISDASHWLGRVGTRQEYIEGYREQLPYVNQLVLEAVQGILRNSDRPPIIVIQGDHGPGAYFDWNSQRKSDLRERMGILTAVYLPPDARQEIELYPELSPVNTTRVMVNAALGADLPLLPDRAYYSAPGRPFDVTDVTAEVRGSPASTLGH